MIFKCKMCGGSLQIRPGETIAVCEYCGTKQTLPNLNDEKRVQLYDRANYFRRENEFDKAMGIYEMILGENKQDCEAYWGIVLCRYGIEYVQDPASGKRIPTVNRAQFTSIFEDADYRSALQFAHSAQKELYRAEAAAIDALQKDILEISNQEDPFDVFICYKETDDQGNRTQDSVYAQEIYDGLTKEGYKVFFSRITLEDKLGKAYEPYIFAALNSAKVMLVVGTAKEHFNAVWVKNEWSRYLALIKAGKEKTLIPAYKGISPYEMPEEFQFLQSQDMGKVGYLQDLIRGIKKIVDVNPVAAVPGADPTAVIVDTMLKRAAEALSHGDWAKADRCYDNVLDYEDHNEQAYIGKMLIDLKMPSLETVRSSSGSIARNRYFLRLTQTGSRQVAKQLNDLEEAIQERIRLEKARQEAQKKAAAAKTAKVILIIAAVIAVIVAGSMLTTRVIIPGSTYSEAQKLLESGAYEQAAEVFASLEGYKDSAAMIHESYYQQAAAAMEQGDYQQAMDTLAARGLIEQSYKDSAQLHNQCGYALAQQAYQRGDYEQAVAAFEAISGYSDADQMITDSQYQQAMDAYESGDLSAAAEAFGAIGGYENAEQLKNDCYYQLARQAYESGDLDGAISAFGAIAAYEDAGERATQISYEAGQKAYEEEKYEKAVGYFSQLGDYKDAAEMTLKAKYAYCDVTKDDPTDTTKTYIRALTEAKYKGASKLAETIFAWKSTVRVEMNMRVGTQTQVGIYVDLRGGDGGKTKVKYVISVAGEVQNYCDEKEYGAGETAEAFLGHPFMDLLQQKFNIKIYDDAGNLIGTFNGYPEDF